MTPPTASNAHEELVPLARSLFGLEVAQLLPVTESFSSQVLRFVDPRGEAYVLKESWSATKAAREIEALKRLEHHPITPTLLNHREHAGRHLILMCGLDGEPMSATEPLTEPLCRAIGEALAILHDQHCADFDGAATWRTLLWRNADAYLTDIGAADRAIAERAHALLGAHLPSVPESQAAVLVHFDLRPGNLLTRDGHLVGLIDFEACRGGHPSMDLFKLWEELSERHPEALPWLLAGYSTDASWTTCIELLMQTYGLYHGLAGLAWCHRRGRHEDPFIARNRRLINGAERVLGSLVAT